MSVRQRGNTKLGLDNEAMQTVAILCGVAMRRVLHQARVESKTEVPEANRVNQAERLPKKGRLGGMSAGYKLGEGTPRIELQGAM